MKTRLIRLITAAGLSLLFLAPFLVSAPQQTKPVWDFQDLCWSPDGKTILFTGIVEKKYRIYRVDAAPGATPVELFKEVSGNLMSPTWSPDGKRIAFHFSRADESGIVVANTDGSGVRKLAQGAITPAWSPNGKWIAYGAKHNGKYQIYVMDADGKNQRQITSNSAASFNPSWSPDNRFLIYESDRDHRDKDEIYRIQAKGSGEVLLKRDEQANLVYPVYSADGHRIAYGAVANRNVDLYVMNADGGNAKLLHRHAGSAHWSKKAGLLAYIAYDENKLRELYTAKPDGTEEVQITRVNHGESAQQGIQRGFHQDLAWAPDGSKICFSWNGEGSFHLYTMRADGTGIARLTRGPANDRYASWAPDGSKIAFASDRAAAHLVDIWVMDADGGNPARLTQDTGSFPSWSKDGRMIAFMAKHGSYWQIYVMNADGSGQKRLTASEANDENPSFSPDGTRVIFESSRDGAGKDQLYSVRIDGSELERLTHNDANNIFPSYSPDGRSILFGLTRPTSGEDVHKIYRMNADGTGMKELAGDGFFARWSPRKDRIAFISGQYPSTQIYLMKPDGRGKKPAGLPSVPRHE